MNSKIGFCLFFTFRKNSLSNFDVGYCCRRLPLSLKLLLLLLLSSSPFGALDQLAVGYFFFRGGGRGRQRRFVV